MSDQAPHTQEPTPEGPLPEPQEILDRSRRSPSTLGAAARTGVALITIVAVMSRGASFITQLLLARLLTQVDFGLYAAAMGTAGFVTAFRDAGVTMYLIRHGRDQYRALVAPVFWFAFAVNMLGAIVLSALAVVLALWPTPTTGTDSALLHAQFPWLLLIIALSMPIGTPGAILKTRMRLELQFKELSAMTLVATLARYFSSVLFALLRLGAQSFVLPMLVYCLIEWVWTQRVTRDRDWWGSPRARLWPQIFRETKWLLVGTLGSVAYNMGSYFLIALFVPARVVGVYFFAYQITQQVCALITTSIQFVLAPVLVHLEGEPERLRVAAERTLRVLMLFAVPLMLGMSVTIDPVERFVLGGEWREAVAPIIAFGALTPLALTWGLTYSILTSKGRFKTWAVGSVVEGAIVTLAPALVAASGGDALGISVATALAMSATRLAITLQSMLLLGVPTAHVLRACGGAWAIGLAVTPPAMFVARRLAFGYSLLEFLAAGTIFVVLYTVAVRAVLARTVSDAITVLPARYRGLTETLLFLRTKPAFISS